MNTVAITGRIVTDVWHKKTATGKSVADFIVAVPMNYRSKITNEVESDFIKVRAWNRKAENIFQYFQVGDRINISGKIKTDIYKKNGTNVYDTYINIDSFDFVDYKRKDTNKDTEDREIKRERFTKTNEEVPF